MSFGPTKTPMWVKIIVILACIGAAFLALKG